MSVDSELIALRRRVEKLEKDVEYLMYNYKMQRLGYE